MIPPMSIDGPHNARRDIAIALLFAVVGVVFVGWLQDGKNGGIAPADPVMGLLILPAVLPVLWRQRAPLLAAAGTLLATALHVIAYGTVTRCGVLLPLLFVEAF